MMTSQRKWTRRREQTVFERMDEALERNVGRSNAALIRQLREFYFADVDALQKSGRVKIPAFESTPHPTLSPVEAERATNL